ncbi:MAG: aspartyl protease family protein [Phycisphaeraceae bacterium]|nr:aspartyl protease family protein [Phycisphaeraceae bacterium]MCB9847749.1 aspartyl protease family protein [Phycisphaeraceae bacterium]
MPNDSILHCIALGAAIALLAPVSALSQAPAPQQQGPADTRPETTTIPRGRVEVPFRMVGHMPAVEALVNGRGPFLFEFDTGGQGLARADVTLAQRLELPVVGQAQGTDGMGGPGRAMDIVAMDSIEIAGARFTGITAATRDYNRTPGARSEHVDGILGFGLFADCVVTIDYPGQKLIIEQGRPLRAGADGVVAFDNARGVPVLPIDIAGEHVDATFDSGSSGGITVSTALAESLPRQGEPRLVGRARTVVREFDIMETTLDGDVTIAGHTIKDPPIGYAEIFNHVNVGSQVMRNFAITFDQASGLMRMTRPEGAGPIEVIPRTSPRAGAAAYTGPGVAVPMLRAGHIPAVMATVNGKGPFLFAVDTGAQGMMHLDESFVREQGLAVIGEMMGADGMTGDAVPMKRVRVGEVGIGGERFTDVVGLSRDYSDIRAMLGGEMVGIIGYGMFADRLVTFDYPGNRLVIERDGALRAGEPGVVEVHETRGIPEIDIELGGRTVRTDLDTGSAGSCTVPEAVFDALRFSDEPVVVGMGRSVSAAFDIRQATLDGAMRFGGVTIENPAIQSTPVAKQANIGAQLLSNFLVTFDQRSGLIRFTPGAAGAPATAAAPKRRLGIMPAIRGDEVTLQAVLPGSAAEAAGLRVGDRITAVNGKPIAELGMAGLGREMAVRPTVVITVEREGRELTFSVTLE